MTELCKPNCLEKVVLGRDEEYYCILQKGHSGKHLTYIDGVSWWY
jgi:hypothetical protein